MLVNSIPYENNQNQIFAQNSPILNTNEIIINQNKNQNEIPVQNQNQNDIPEGFDISGIPLNSPDSTTLSYTLKDRCNIYFFVVFIFICLLGIGLIIYGIYFMIGAIIGGIFFLYWEFYLHVAIL